MAELSPAQALLEELAELAATIDRRAAGEASARPSYTAKLLAAGPLACAKKLGEEGVEAALAVAAGSEADVAAEAADLLYHLMTALASRGVPLQAVGEVLARRRGVSGLDEKAGRASD